MVTGAPTEPDVADTNDTDGAVTVKLTPLLGTPATVTTTLPVVAPSGTTEVMLVLLQFVAPALMPLNLTVLAP